MQSLHVNRVPACMCTFQRAQYVSSRYQDPSGTDTERPSGSKLERHRAAQKTLRVRKPIHSCLGGSSERTPKLQIAEEAALDADAAPVSDSAIRRVCAWPAPQRKSSSYILHRALQQDLCQVLACLAEELRRMPQGTPHNTARCDPSGSFYKTQDGQCQYRAWISHVKLIAAKIAMQGGSTHVRGPRYPKTIKAHPIDSS